MIFVCHIVIGVTAFALGVWGIRANWWAFLELLYVTVSVYLIFRGGVAVAKGLSTVLGAGSPELHRR